MPNTNNASERRQVLANIGNRFVVFGNEGGLPEPIRFDPAEIPLLPRVGDESEVAESRIAETLQIAGLGRSKETSADTGALADLAFSDPDGNSLLVEIKVRQHDPRRRDLESGSNLLRRASAEGDNLELWFFNTERLKLTVMRQGLSGLQVESLFPLDVWEKTERGVFKRQDVVDAVEDWLARLDQLYTTIRGWLVERPDLRFEQSRSVTMSEELMQRFAVSDREVGILDVLHSEEVVASFVPRGLWVIGARGRVDVITRAGTRMIIALKEDDHFTWSLVQPQSRRAVPLERASLLALVDGQ